MALYKLDCDGNPIKRGGKKRPIQDAQGRYHWDYVASQSGRTKAMHRRFWAHASEVEGIIAAFQENKPVATANGLKWIDAFGYWQDGHRLTSDKHITSLGRSIKNLCDYFKNPNLTIQETTRGMMREWLNKRSEVSATTANEARKILAIAKYCWEELEYLQTPPSFLGIKGYQVQEKRREAIPLDEIGQYLQAADKHYGAGLRLIAEFMFFSGVRSTEAAEIDDPDHVAQDKITIWQKAKGAGKRKEEVPVDAYLRALIERARAYKRQLIEQALQEVQKAREKADSLKGDKLRHRRALTRIETMQKVADQANACRKLFVNSSGTAWNENTIRKRWQHACEAAGLRYYVPHECRHSFATIAGAANYNETYIQAAMRWDDAAMAKRYVHETHDMSATVAKTVRGRLAGALGLPVPEEDKPEPKTITRSVPGLTGPAEIVCDCGAIIKLIPAKPEESGVAVAAGDLVAALNRPDSATPKEA